jgi:hypothetical protein
LFTLLHDNETKTVQHCCVAKERKNDTPVHCYAAGHRRHVATETITRNNILKEILNPTFNKFFAA